MIKYVEFSLDIASANDAFQPDPTQEIARIMLLALQDLREGTRDIHDVNGNVVGQISLEIEDEL